MEDIDIHKDIKNLSEKIAEMDEHLRKMDERLQLLVSNVEGVHTSAKNMDEHIAFINGVYTQIHRPFHALMDAAGQFIGGGNELKHSSQDQDLSIQSYVAEE